MKTKLFLLALLVLCLPLALVASEEPVTGGTVEHDCSLNGASEIAVHGSDHGEGCSNFSNSEAPVGGDCDHDTYSASGAYLTGSHYVCNESTGVCQVSGRVFCNGNFQSYSYSCEGPGGSLPEIYQTPSTAICGDADGDIKHGCPP